MARASSSSRVRIAGSVSTRLCTMSFFRSIPPDAYSMLLTGPEASKSREAMKLERDCGEEIYLWSSLEYKVR